MLCEQKLTSVCTSSSNGKINPQISLYSCAADVALFVLKMSTKPTVHSGDLATK